MADAREGVRLRADVPDLRGQRHGLIEVGEAVTVPELVAIRVADAGQRVDLGHQVAGGAGEFERPLVVGAGIRVPLLDAVGERDAVQRLRRGGEVAVGEFEGLPVVGAGIGHSIAAPYVRWQLERNRAELGRHRLDTVFLHNPERTTRPDQLYDQLRAAFAVLEEAAAAGHLTTYGIAT
ncbi:hypothetical protein ACFYWY_01885 [Streptomyces sp. NPDC002870]|uniref:hypothetical protein n=1 Tax=Streptomyces sp. NPDC002870 TaxID=3364666 RepID=UPI003678816C